MNPQTDALLTAYDAFEILRDPVGYCDRTGQDYKEVDWIVKKIRSASIRVQAALSVTAPEELVKLRLALGITQLHDDLLDKDLEEMALELGQHESLREV